MSLGAPINMHHKLAKILQLGYPLLNHMTKIEIRSSCIVQNQSVTAYTVISGHYVSFRYIR